MKVFKCIIVDDDEVDRLMAISMVKQYSQLHLVGAFENAEVALSAVDFSRIDVVFLDIDMDGMDGISFRKIINDVPACIFITSHPEYALDSFSVETLDFLLKPLSLQRFGECITRLQTFMDVREKAHLYVNLIGSDHIFIKEGSRETKIALHDVLYLEGLKDYTLLVTAEKKHCVLRSIGNLLKELHFSHFLRIHRSFAVRKDLIKAVSAKEVLLANNINIPLGRSFKDGIKTLLAGER